MFSDGSELARRFKFCITTNVSYRELCCTHTGTVTSAVEKRLNCVMCRMDWQQTSRIHAIVHVWRTRQSERERAESSKQRVCIIMREYVLYSQWHNVKKRFNVELCVYSRVHCLLLLLLLLSLILSLAHGVRSDSVACVREHVPIVHYIHTFDGRYYAMYG